MPTLDEQFEQWWENPNSSANELHLPDEDAARISFAAGKLAGAAAEREAALAIIAEYRNLALGQMAIHLTADAQAMLNELERRIRQRGEGEK